MKHRARQERTSSCRSSRLMWRMGNFFTMYTRQARPDTPWESTVAREAPATPSRNTRIKARSRPIFSTDDMAKKYTGVLLSPRERMMAANRL